MDSKFRDRSHEDENDVLVPNAGSLNSVPVQSSQLNDPVDSSEIITGEVLANPETVTSLDNAAIAGNLTPHLPNSGLTFLFAKRLSVTDCRIKYGKLRLPILPAKMFFPMKPGLWRMPLVIKDTEGQTWNFNLCMRSDYKGEKYAIVGIRKCLRKMKWNAGDTLKFYRQLSDGELVMELVRAAPSRTTS